MPEKLLAGNENNMGELTRKHLKKEHYPKSFPELDIDLVINKIRQKFKINIRGKAG